MPRVRRHDARLVDPDGVFAGPLGSTTGQHRFHPAAVVREEQDNVRLWTPMEGAFEMRARMELDAASMAALWMIGYEDRPERSAEICIAEVFGRNVTTSGTVVGLGLQPFGDHDVVDDFAEIHVAIDVREPHAYAAVWTPGGVRFWIDGPPVREVAQAPSYPMQLMLGLYAFDEPGAAATRRFVVERIRGWCTIRSGDR